MKLKIKFLLAIAAATAALPVAVAAMPPAEAWEIGPRIRGRNYSEGMPAHPSQGSRGSLMIDFPVAGAGQVDAVTTAIRPLAGAKQITMRYRVDAAPGTRFIAVETPGQPATVSLYFQRAGDNWSAKGRYASYRWYVPARAVMPLSPGEHTVTVRFDERWTNVYGKPNLQLSEAFAAALGDAARIGIAFGSRSGRSHGVYATGPASFTLLSLDIE